MLVYLVSIWLERKRRDELFGSEEIEKLVRDEGKWRNKMWLLVLESLVNFIFF